MHLNSALASIPHSPQTQGEPSEAAFISPTARAVVQVAHALPGVYPASLLADEGVRMLGDIVSMASSRGLPPAWRKVNNRVYYVCAIASCPCMYVRLCVCVHVCAVEYWASMSVRVRSVVQVAHALPRVYPASLLAD